MVAGCLAAAASPRPAVAEHVQAHHIDLAALIAEEALRAMHYAIEGRSRADPSGLKLLTGTIRNRCWASAAMCAFQMSLRS